MEKRKLKKRLGFLTFFAILMIAATTAFAGEEDTYDMSDWDCNANWHIFNEFYVPATCTTDGSHEKTCSKCGYYTYETIPATGHSYGEWQTITKATCTIPGFKNRTCSVCGNVDEYNTGLAEHSYQDGLKVGPTCTKEGIIAHECQDCGYYYEEPAPAPGHKPEGFDTVRKATCSEKGLQQGTCTRCGEIVEKYIDKTAHSYGSWTVTEEPTDHSNGTKTRTCTVCGAADRDEVTPEGTIFPGTQKKELAVYVLQELLKEENYLNDKVDGIYGKNTEEAVKAYQKEKQFEETGIAYPQTISALMKDLLDRKALSEGSSSTLDNGISVKVSASGEETELLFEQDGASYSWKVKVEKEAAASSASAEIEMGSDESADTTENDSKVKRVLKIG